MATLLLNKPRQSDRDELITILGATPGKAEIIHGEIVTFMPTGGLPNFAAGEIYAAIRLYAKQTRRGVAITDNAGFVVRLPNRWSFSPDAAYWIGPAPT